MQLSTCPQNPTTLAVVFLAVQLLVGGDGAVLKNNEINNGTTTMNLNNSSVTEFDMNEVFNAQSALKNNKTSDISSTSEKGMLNNLYGSVLEKINSSHSEITPKSFLKEYKMTVETSTERLVNHSAKNNVLNTQFDSAKIQQNINSTHGEVANSNYERSIVKGNFTENVKIKLPSSATLKYNDSSNSMQNKHEYNNESTLLEPRRQHLKMMDSRMPRNSSSEEHQDIAANKALEFVTGNTLNNNPPLNVSVAQSNSTQHTESQSTAKDSLNNELGESNEIFSTSMKPNSEKRAKFIHDNSTNMNQVNLPDASEVWTLVGMKAVPSKSDQSNREKLATGDGSLNGSSTTNNNEKNLFDWTQIMLTDGLNNQNSTETSTTADDYTTSTSTNEVAEESYTNSTSLKSTLLSRLTNTTVATPFYYTTASLANSDGVASEQENTTFSPPTTTLNSYTFTSSTGSSNVNNETTTIMSSLTTDEQREMTTSQPLAENNFSTTLQTSPTTTTTTTTTSNYNGDTLKTATENSAYEISTQANVADGETTLENAPITTTVSNLETGAVSTSAVDRNYGIRSNVTDIESANDVSSTTTTTTTTTLTTILYGENTTAIASVKANEVDFALSTTSERIATSSSTHRTYSQAEQTTSSTLDDTLLFSTTTTPTTTSAEVPQTSSPTATSSETSTTMTTELASSSPESIHGKEQATSESEKASIDVNFIDGPHNNTATVITADISTDKLEQGSNAKSVLPAATTVGTFTLITTTEAPGTSTFADTTSPMLTSTISSLGVDDISTTTAATYALPTTEPTAEATPSPNTITTPITMPKLNVPPPTLFTTTHSATLATIDSPELQPGSADTHEMDINVIIAISVSVIGIIALVLLVGFLYVVRKRQKQLSYGHRCRPVSLDAYSLDNVSVYNSVRRKSALRSSKRSYGNVAFDDPALRHNLLNASELAKFVERRSAVFDEFKYVPQIIARPDEVPHGCEDKNRYANVIPIPETRVSLQQQNNDIKTEYINANYVRGPRDSPKYYIACQAPLESTVADFWRMVWEQKSRVIIQATDLVENGIEKCAEYLPPSVTLDNHTSYGDFQITLKNREVKEKYAISTIMLKNSANNLCRELTHYWYKWPEVGVPNEEASIIAMLLEARSSLKCYAAEQSSEMKENSSGLSSKPETPTSQRDTERKDSHSTCKSNGDVEELTSDKPKTATTIQGPLTVHCSPGTGRTGTIIACDVAIRNLENPRRSVDVPQLVYFVRRGRASAVQTKEQYEFIYKVANMYATKITNVSSDN